MDKKVIVVCGDSFLSIESNTRNHFSNLLEDEYGYQVINLAHPGVSNAVIFFQIRLAIRFQPNAIIYNQTWSDRINLTWQDKFVIQKGLENFYYYKNTNFDSKIKEFVGNENTASVLSIGWQSIEKNPAVEFTDEQQQAVNLYLRHLYHDEMQTEIDSWIYDYWKSKINSSGIQGICFNDSTIGLIAYEFAREIKSYPSVYHTDAATQKIIAARIHASLQHKEQNDKS